MGEVGEQAYNWRAMGEKETFRERKRFRVSCTKCRVTVKQLYLKQHMESLHGICVPQTRGRDIFHPWNDPPGGTESGRLKRGQR